MACATQTQFRRGTAAANAAFTGVEGEVTYATDTHRLYTHDGVTVGGFALALFSDIATQARLSLSVSAPLNYNNGTGAFTITLADTTHDGYISSADWNTFNAKQAALGFTPENVANKSIDGTFAANSDTLYPSQKAAKTYIDTGLATKQNSLGFTPENVANKSIDGTFAANSDTLYPSQKAAKTYVDAGLATKLSSTLPGADKEVLLNSGGVLGSDSGFIYDIGSQIMSVLSAQIGPIGIPSIILDQGGTASFMSGGVFALKILAGNHVTLANDGVDILDGLVQVEDGFKVDGPGPTGLSIRNSDTATVVFSVAGATGLITATNTLDMGSAKISSLAAPVAGGDATNKTYVDTGLALKLNLAGGTMSGAIAMGTNKIIGLGNPTAAQDAATKTYVDSGTPGNKVFNYNSFR